MGVQQSAIVYIGLAIVVVGVASLIALWKANELKNEQQHHKTLMDSMLTLQDLSEDILPAIQKVQDDTLKLRSDLEQILFSTNPTVISNTRSPESKDRSNAQERGQEKESSKEDSDVESESDDEDSNNDCDQPLVRTSPNIQDMAMLMSMGSLFAKVGSETTATPVTRVVVERMASPQQSGPNEEGLTTIGEISDENVS